MAEKSLDRSTSQVSLISWAILLVVYLSLFGASGYVAFFTSERNPATEIVIDNFNKIVDADLKSTLLKGLELEGKGYEKKRDLAFQTFNVVLGAILGFLSASAANSVRSRTSREPLQRAAERPNPNDNEPHR